ncbi:MAG: hypothetical protein J5632_04010 [Bacteroidales bacterium]|nr:hypothetical protein [Bacteroidales bacterium]
MRKIFYIFAAALLLFGCGKDDMTVAPKPKSSKCKVYIAGDSTAADKKSTRKTALEGTEGYNAEENPNVVPTDPNYYTWGWGEKLQELLDGNTVKNQAVGGQSSKTFISKNFFSKNIMKPLLKNDVVLIQFGHNDENQTASDGRGTTPDEFYENIRKMITDVRGKSGIPVVLTPICRYSWDDEGHPKHGHSNSLGDYKAKCIQAAVDAKCDYFDIEQAMWDLMDQLGQDESKKFFMISVEGSTDTTHLTEAGALKVAELVVEALKGSKNTKLSALPKP